MEKIGARPVENGHEIIADHFHSERSEVADRLNIIVNVFVPGRQADFDVVMDVDGFHHIHIEAIGIQLFLHFGNFFRLPDFSGQLVVQSPDNCGYSGDLFYIGKRNSVISFAVPAKTHLHRHGNLLKIFRG